MSVFDILCMPLRELMPLSMLIVFAFIFGSCLGSFLNVCIWRIPLGESVVVVPSHCPKCNHKIRWFDNVPVMLSNNPLLKAKIEADNAEMKNVNLAYLANGFEWKANYVAKIKDAENLELLGRVVVNNHSGSDYEDTKINLMAGEVNTVKEVMPRLKTMMVRSSAPMMEADGMANSLVMADTIEPESLNGFYLYSLPFNVSLKDGETKMVSFLDEKNVKYKKDNVLFSDI